VVRRVTGGETTRYHHGPAGNLLFTSDGAGTVRTIYIWKGSTLAAMLTGPSLLTDVRYPLMDNLGAVMAVVKPDGTSEVNYAYQPYGGKFRQAQPGALDPGLLTFVGGLGVQDEGAGLYYMRSRFYDSTTGRFLQRDPAGLDGGINLYIYAMANPIGLIDPSGLGGQPWEDDPGMNEKAVREAEERYQYWEANGGWANRPQIPTGTGQELQNATFYVADKALGLTPGCGTAYGALKTAYYVMWKGEKLKGAWEGVKTALGPYGDVIDFIEDLVPQDVKDSIHGGIISTSEEVQKDVANSGPVKFAEGVYEQTAADVTDFVEKTHNPWLYIEEEMQEDPGY
jgi:RHS repeat-associated protein